MNDQENYENIVKQFDIIFLEEQRTVPFSFLLTELMMKQLLPGDTARQRHEFLKDAIDRVNEDSIKRFGTPRLISKRGYQGGMQINPLYVAALSGKVIPTEDGVSEKDERVQVPSLASIKKVLRKNKKVKLRDNSSYTSPSGNRYQFVYMDWKEKDVIQKAMEGIETYMQVIRSIVDKRDRQMADHP